MSAPVFRDNLLVGQVALVSGGTGSIGAAIAAALATCGAAVTVTSATPEEAKSAKAHPAFRGRDARALDVRDAAASRRSSVTCHDSTFW
jgi:NAD(P)-dependent dehydrogenase (short-subunit alcohol dehydrogenase family)